MVTVREPRLNPVPLADLRPTQITLGMREVEAKRKSWRRKSGNHAETFLGQHMIPVILGPKDRRYVIDHHHLGRALLEEGVTDVLVTIVADLSRLEPDSFWFFLDNHGWMHPFDSEGKRRGYDALPKNLGAMEDDPYRSLAGELRLIGGYAKDTTPFSEFVWADFLRRHITRKALDKDFDAALRAAFDLAKTAAADYLPGWCGASLR